MSREYALYDTTLRDGAQCEDMQLTTPDKVKIALRLDELGMDYIEGGWPGANPVDSEFFHEIAAYELKRAKIAAFGSTHHPSHAAENDPTLMALLSCGARVLTIFGKSSERHAKDALRLDPARNLNIIRDSVAFLRSRAEEVFFDAEHFFDGWKENRDYTLAALKRAHEAGASALVLCDTNGGNLPEEIAAVTAEVVRELPDAVVGIHAHNDCELGVANAIAAVRSGARHIQGTMNGVGERCGNANLCSVIPVLELKMGLHCLPEGSLTQLTAASRYVSEVANMTPFSRQPFVGRSAFAHKGGVHVSAVNRDSTLYEHIRPESVGNGQRILITELGGRSNIVSLARRFGFHLDKDEPVVKGLFNELKKKASQGYDYAAAEATVMVEVEGVVEHTAATGQGPVNALDNALRKALLPFYPRLAEMRLRDFKVRVLTASSDGEGEDATGTAAVTRVLIESADSDGAWVTVGVSYDIIEASWQALADSVVYKLYRDEWALHGAE